MKLLMNFVRKHNFTPFAYYRIVLGLMIIALISFQIL
jgi:undecaprenyl pyrophosphate phosphatase UppP